MSNNQNKKKRVVTTTATAKSTKSGVSTSRMSKKEPRQLLFNKQNYLYMIIGVVLIALGMVLMSGGHMPDPNTWDEDIIYGTRRTVVAPILILLGLGVQIYAIFKK